MRKIINGNVNSPNTTAKRKDDVICYVGAEVVLCR